MYNKIIILTIIVCVIEIKMFDLNGFLLIFINLKNLSS